MKFPQKTRRLLPLAALVVLMLFTAGLLLWPATVAEERPADVTYLRIGEHENQGVRFIEPTVTATVMLDPGETTRVSLGTPGPGAPGLVIRFEMLNEFKQPVAGEVWVDGELQGQNLYQGQINLPPAGEGLVLEFRAESFEPISYTLNYRVKRQQRQQLTVEFQSVQGGE